MRLEFNRRGFMNAVLQTMIAWAVATLVAGSPSPKSQIPFQRDVPDALLIAK